MFLVSSCSCFTQPIESRCEVENEDVVGAAPTPSGWSTILLPAKVRLTSDAPFADKNNIIHRSHEVFGDLSQAPDLSFFGEGVRVAIHASGTRPSPVNVGTDVQRGHSSSIGVTGQKIVKAPFLVAIALVKPHIHSHWVIPTHLPYAIKCVCKGI